MQTGRTPIPIKRPLPHLAKTPIRTKVAQQFSREANMMRTLAATGALVLTLAYAAASPAQAPQDALTDPALKRAEVLAFIGIKPGDKIADIIAGRFVRAFSEAVGPTGRVYAVDPAEVVKAHPTTFATLNTLAANPAYANVTVVSGPIDELALPHGLNEVFIRQNYHDLHDKFMGPADIAKFNRHVYEALKPGGVFVVLDHSAPGTDLAATETLHRIDEAAVKREVEAAGFVLDAESNILANPADDHTKMVFDPAIRGKTDQFLLRFKKPG
jgi:predicted methyltransferase